MEKTFVLDGVEYTVNPCTAIPSCDLADAMEFAYDSSKHRQKALLVQNTSESGEEIKYVVFGHEMPENAEDFAAMCDDFTEWENDYEVLDTVWADPTTNRQIVQEGLDARAAQRAEAAEDAFHEAAERSLLAVVNRNAQTRPTAKKTAKANRGTKNQTIHIYRKAANRNIFLERTFGSMLIPSLMTYYTAYGWIPAGFTIAAWIADGLFIIANTVAFALRNRTAKEAMAKAWKRIVKKNNTINRKGE